MEQANRRNEQCPLVTAASDPWTRSMGFNFFGVRIRHPVIRASLSRRVGLSTMDPLMSLVRNKFFTVNVLGVLTLTPMGTPDTHDEVTPEGTERAGTLRDGWRQGGECRLGRGRGMVKTNWRCGRLKHTV